MEQAYEDAAIRVQDIMQLEQIAGGYPSRERFLTELTLDDFEIFEDDKKQTIRFFASGEAGAVPEMHVGLLFDTSGSMDDDIRLARTAAIRFLDRLPDAEDFTIVDFDTEVRVGTYEQGDCPRMIERIRSLGSPSR